MFRWYVKDRYQEDHEERAAALGCGIILEDTSSQVDVRSPLPHVIVQTLNRRPDGGVDNVFPDLPNSRATLAALNAVREPASP